MTVSYPQADSDNLSLLVPVGVVKVNMNVLSQYRFSWNILTCEITVCVCGSGNFGFGRQYDILRGDLNRSDRVRPIFGLFSDQ